MGKQYYHFIIRHGPIHHNESINFNKYLKIITKQILYIKNFLNVNALNQENIIIHSSPIKRCYTTAKFILTYLNVIFENLNIKIKIDKNLTRVDDKNGETLEKCHNRAKLYGHEIYNNYKHDKNINIFITHSSILKSLISGISNQTIKNDKLFTSSLSIINANTRKLIIYNKSFFD